MTLTDQQLERTARMLMDYAKEPVKVEQISGAIYAFGSELATLRIFAKYNGNGANPNQKFRVGYSINMNIHFFVMDL